MMAKRRFSTPPEILWCPNTHAGGNANGWRFPSAVAKHLEAEFADRKVLQLFGGQSKFGLRLDVDPIVRPDVLGDAWLPPFRRDSFDIVILDPPYFHMNAQMKTALFRAAAWIARDYVVWFSTVWQAASGGLRLERSWLVRVGDSCHVRCLQYFTIKHKLGPVPHFNRGPAMKYNKWLAGQQDLPGARVKQWGNEAALH
jgi:hypothetical protein